MKRKKLVEALTKLFPAVAKNPIVEEEGDFRINGKILRAMDGKTLIQIILDEGTGLDCRVPAAGFFKYIRSIRDEDIELVLDGTDLTLKAGRKRYKVSVALDGASLDRLDVTEVKWAEVPEGVLEGIRRCRFAVSTDSDHGALCGVRICGSHVVGANPFRIAAFELKAPATDEASPLVITKELAAQLTRYESEITGWARDGDAVFFRIGDSMVVVAKTLTSSYPDVLKWILDSEGLQIEAELPTELKTALRRHQEQQSDEALLDQEVVVSFADGTLTVESEGRDGSYRATDEFDADGAVTDGVRFKVHPGFLADILDDTRTIAIGEEGRHVRFVVDSFTYLTSTERA